MSESQEKRMKNQSLFISLCLNMERKPKENEEKFSMENVEVNIIEWSFCLN